MKNIQEFEIGDVYNIQVLTTDDIELTLQIFITMVNDDNIVVNIEESNHPDTIGNSLRIYETGEIAATITDEKEGEVSEIIEKVEEVS